MWVRPREYMKITVTGPICSSLLYGVGGGGQRAKRAEAEAMPSAVVCMGDREDVRSTRIEEVEAIVHVPTTSDKQ